MKWLYSRTEGNLRPEYGILEKKTLYLESEKEKGGFPMRASITEGKIRRRFY